MCWPTFGAAAAAVSAVSGAGGGGGGVRRRRRCSAPPQSKLPPPRPKNLIFHTHFGHPQGFWAHTFPPVDLAESPLFWQCVKHTETKRNSTCGPADPWTVALCWTCIVPVLRKLFVRFKCASQRNAFCRLLSYFCGHQSICAITHSLSKYGRYFCQLEPNPKAHARKKQQLTSIRFLCCSSNIHN